MIGNAAIRSLVVLLAVGVCEAKLNITTTSLANGTVGIGYSGSLQATSGSPPYRWSVSAGALPAGLSLSSGGSIGGTPSAAGTFNFTARVTDDHNDTDTQALQLVIRAALAISTASLPGGTAGVSYSASLSASGGTTPYSWAISTGSLPGGLALNASSGAISGTPGAAGTFNFTVRATDAASGSATKGLSITISVPPLVITSSSVGAAIVGIVYSQSLGASGGSPPYAWSIMAGTLPAGLSLNAGGTISGTPGAVGTFNFTAKVTDGASASATKALTLIVNAPPLAITTSSLAGGTAGAAYSQGLSATGGTPPYSWSIASGSLPAGVSLNAGGTISGAPGSAGTFNFTVKVTDSGSVSAIKALSLTVSAPPLLISTVSLPSGMAGGLYVQTLGATGGTPPYVWSVESGSLPGGLNLTPGGTISGTAGVAGTFNFTVKVTDSTSASVTRALSLTVSAPALAISTASLPSGTAGTAYSQTLAAAGGTPPYVWSVESGSLPGGLNLSAGGTISGTAGVAGTFNFTVKVTDSGSVSASKPFTVIINPPAPSISSAGLPGGSLGASYSQTLGATGGTPPYSWTISSSALPPGLVLSAAGIISGEPTTIGTFTFVVQVTDSASASATRSLSIQIGGAALLITTGPLPPAVVGTPYAQTLSATGGIAGYRWSISSGSLPPGLTLDSAGSITGTPTLPGTFTFAAQASDSSGVTTNKNLSITVSVPLVFETKSLADASLSAAYTQSLRASGGTSPYTWSVTAGALPDGIRLDSARGLLNGTAGAAGTFTFTIRVTDSASVFTERQFTIETAAGLIITSAPLLATGAASVPYSQALSAAGGRAPYVWSISAGGLPTGISLEASSGSLSGTPTNSGAFPFTVQVTDSVGRIATKQFSITVAAILAISSAPSLPQGTAGASYAQTLAASGGAPPYSWSITSGALPGGVDLDASAGTIAGAPAAAGSFTFTVQVIDSASVTAVKQFTLAIRSAVILTTQAKLADAMLGSPYAQAVSATGGVAPYTWTILAGALPPGLELDPVAGTIGGTAGASGTYAFTVQVADAAGAKAARDYSITVNTPDLPSISIDGLPDRAEASAQPSFSVAVASPYPVPLTGRIAMSFDADAVVPGDDPSVQFASGGRTATFTVPANATTAKFSIPQLAIQTGTVAGTISLNLALESGGAETAPSVIRTVRIERSEPAIRSVSAAKTTSGFELRITGFSTSRELTRAVVRLTPVAGSDLQTSELSIPLSDVATRWYQDSASKAFGSQFTLVLPFAIQGNAGSIDLVSVMLVNQQGASKAASAKF